MTGITNLFSFFADGSLLVNSFIGATAVLVLATVGVTLLRSHSAALRHRVWTLAMVAILAMPACIMLLPHLGPRWLSRWSDVNNESIAWANHEKNVVSVDGASTNIEVDGHYFRAAQLPNGDISSSRTILLDESDSLATAKGNQRNEQSTGTNLAPTSKANTTGPTSEGWKRVAFVKAAFCVWLAGIAIGVIVLIRNCRAAASIVRRAVSITYLDTVNRTNQLREHAKIKTVVPLLCSSEAHAPLTIGCFRPVIVLPTGYGHWTEERRRVVLAHEMAHIQRRDVLLQLVARLACVLYWCHPLVWLANWRMRVEREFACDDAVLKMGEMPGKYASHLVDVAVTLLSTTKTPAYAVAMVSHNSLERRVRAILHPRTNRTPVARTTGRVLFVSMLAVVVVVSLMSPATSKDSSPTSNGTTVPTNNAANSGKKSLIQNTRDADSKTGANDTAAENISVSGDVVDEQGQPVAGAVVSFRYSTSQVSASTDSRGRFQLAIPKQRIRGASLLAAGPTGTLGLVQLPWEVKPDKTVASPPIKLKAPRSIQADVIQRDGKAVGGVKVVINADYVTIAESTTNAEGHATLTVPKGAPLQFAFADAGSNGVDYMLFRRPDVPQSDPYQLAQDHSGPIKLTLSPTRSLQVRVIDQDGKPINGARVYPWYVELPKKGGDANLGSLWVKKTGLDGVATFDSIPVEQERKLTIWVQMDGFVARERMMIDVKTADPIVTSTLLALVPVAGQVKYPDGTPAKGITVSASGGSYRTDDYHGETMTSDDGRFRLNVDPETFCMFVAGDGNQWASNVESRIILNQPVGNIELKLQRSTRVFGRLLAKGTELPLADQYISLYLKRGENENDYYSWPKDKQLPNPTDSRKAVLPRIVKSVQTDKEGRFSFFTGPGAYYLIGPKGLEPPKFIIKDEPEMEFNLQADRPLEGTLQGRVVLVTNPDQGVPEVSVFGYPLVNSDGGFLRATTDADGKFEAKRDSSAQLIGAFTKDKKLGSIVQLEVGANKIVLPLTTTTILRGTLISEETGAPAADEEIGASIRVEHRDGTSMSAFKKTSTTDKAGRFEITGVVPGHKYDVDVVTDRDSGGRARAWRRLKEIEPTANEIVSLGELQLPRPYVPPSIDDYIARAFGNQEDLSSRLAQRLSDAKLTYQQVLLIVADHTSKPTRHFFEAQYDYDAGNKELLSALANYLIIGVEASRSDFLSNLGITAPNKNGATLVILNTTGKMVTEANIEKLETDGTLNRTLLTEFLNKRNVPLPNATEGLTAALANAAQEDKRVLVQVSGPGCAPCVLLARYLDKHKEVISRDYVYLKIDTRMPGAEDVIKKLRPTKERSIPWTVILSADGERLITSDSDKGNIGFPSDQEGKLHFENMLRSTRKRLTDDDIKSVMTALDM